VRGPHVRTDDQSIGLIVIGLIPSSVLENNSVAVWVFEGFPVSIPIGIKRGNRREPRRDHAVDGCIPFNRIRYIEDDQVVFGRGTADRVPYLLRELEVIRNPTLADHYTVKAIVSRKLIEQFKTKTGTVELAEGFQIITWPRHANCQRLQISGPSHVIDPQHLEIVAA